VLDSILFEKAGVPAVSIVTDAFVETGKLMSSKWGLPGFRYGFNKKKFERGFPKADHTHGEYDFNRRFSAARKARRA
jgi:hypothetical protein